MTGRVWGETTSPPANTRSHDSFLVCRCESRKLAEVAVVPTLEVGAIPRRSKSGCPKTSRGLESESQ
eukprot:CAMPEP_0174864190 /NCGR_PEP_ID=MMETSP1114-20130205/57881_1 /TAXON_ID=312471 /ORGANISM="Neobodo designis, Strain CCAP 1951/1" /LENGTH=66 /DNA_ID=CAMNT_0016099277 /DNA_START=293 /DNA_END=493 /DNA_ORIENTATION=-